jgi:hypothetical protein
MHLSRPLNHPDGGYTLIVRARAGEIGKVCAKRGLITSLQRWGACPSYNSFPKPAANAARRGGTAGLIEWAAAIARCGPADMDVGNGISINGDLQSSGCARPPLFEIVIIPRAGHPVISYCHKCLADITTCCTLLRRIFWHQE